MPETAPINPFRPDQGDLDKDKMSFLEDFAGATPEELAAAGITETGNDELRMTNDETNPTDPNQLATQEEIERHENELVECAGIEVTRREQRQIEEIIKKLNAERLKNGLDTVELGGKIKLLKISIGGKTKEEWRQTLEKNGTYVSGDAQKIFDSDEFDLQVEEQSLILFYFKIRDISGLDLRTTEEIFNKVQKIGMGFCPAEVALSLCTEFKNNAFGTSIKVGMKEYTDDEGQGFMFSVERRGNSMCLEGDWATKYAKWNPTVEFVFCLPD